MHKLRPNYGKVVSTDFILQNFTIGFDVSTSAGHKDCKNDGHCMDSKGGSCWGSYEFKESLHWYKD